MRLPRCRRPRAQADPSRPERLIGAVVDAPADDRVTSSARSKIDCGILQGEIATAAGSFAGGLTLASLSAGISPENLHASFVAWSAQSFSYLWPLRWPPKVRYVMATSGMIIALLLPE
jgi:hypothetical protein